MPSLAAGPSISTGRASFRLTLGAGLALLAVGGLLLAIGGAVFPSDPAALSLWTVLIGLFIVLGTMVVALVPIAARPAHAPPAPVTAEEIDAALQLEAPPPEIVALAPEPAPEAVPAPVPAVATRAVERATPFVAPNPLAPPMTARGLPATSIPGAYLQSLGADAARDGPIWSEVAPPIAAALPFSPGMQRRPDAPIWSEEVGSEPEEPRLELELARLRARVRELETPPPAVRPAPVAVASVRGLEPPAPPATKGVARPSCIGCGSGVDPASPKLLCWSCGRTLCGSCYWRFGPGPSVHRCPDCAARATASPPVTISGGRSGPTPSGPAAAALSRSR